jgi:hypothetical protein
VLEKYKELSMFEKVKEKLRQKNTKNLQTKECFGGSTYLCVIKIRNQISVAATYTTYMAIAYESIYCVI